jgi:uncharacterized glyoxalase superfamily protein PhnB
MSADDAPIFTKVNLIARDVAATLNFYCTLGLPIAAGSSGEGGFVHINAQSGGGAQLDIDNLGLAGAYDADWRRPGGGQTVLLGFDLLSRQAVDDYYSRLVTSGSRGVQPPYDAFWGSRYAIVEDPDGNAVGLMSPRDGPRSWPPEPSPSP